jgi:hypothetical protein
MTEKDQMLINGIREMRKNIDQSIRKLRELKTNHENIFKKYISEDPEEHFNELNSLKKELDDKSTEFINELGNEDKKEEVLNVIDEIIEDIYSYLPDENTQSQIEEEIENKKQDARMEKAIFEPQVNMNVKEIKNKKKMTKKVTKKVKDGLSKGVNKLSRRVKKIKDGFRKRTKKIGEKYSNWRISKQKKLSKKKPLCRQLKHMKSKNIDLEKIKEWNQNDDNTSKYDLTNIKNEKVLKNICTLINFYKKEGSPFGHIDKNDEEGLMGEIIKNMYEKEKVFWETMVENDLESAFTSNDNIEDSWPVLRNQYSPVSSHNLFRRFPQTQGTTAAAAVTAVEPEAVTAVEPEAVTAVEPEAVTAVEPEAVTAVERHCR